MLQEKGKKLNEAREKLATERVKTSELAQRVDAMQTKLAQVNPKP